MALDSMPGDPLRFAASTLRRIRREWNSMRFFDRENYPEGFPSNADIVNAVHNDIGNRKRPVNEFSWNSLPTDTHAAGPEVVDTRIRRGLAKTFASLESERR